MQTEYHKPFFLVWLKLILVHTKRVGNYVHYMVNPWTIFVSPKRFTNHNMEPLIQAFK